MVDLQFKNYHITSNKYGYNVCKMSMEDGKPLFNQTKNGLQIREQPVGYYHDLRQALKGIVRNILRAGDERIESIKLTISSLFFIVLRPIADVSTDPKS